MQGIKDAFYLMLRGRIAAGNAGRTVEVRGVVRPGVVVDENELPSGAPDAAMTTEVFHVRWVAASAVRRGVVPLWTLGCEVLYATEGSVSAGGMDRGRALAAMDAELSAALEASPGFAEKVPADGTNIFWGAVSFGPAVIRGERMERTAAVEVFGYE